MKFRRFVITTITLSSLLSMTAGLCAQTPPGEKARQDKAREFLKKAQDNLASSQRDDLADMGRGDICRTQAELGDTPAAMQTAAKIQFLKIEAVSEIARIEGKRGNKQQAVQILHDAMTGLGAKPRPDDLGTIGETEAQLGDIDGAKKIAISMSASSQVAEILCAIAGAQAKAGDLAGAKQTFASAQGALKVSKDRYPAVRQGDIALQQLEAGDGPGARQTADAIASPSERASAYLAMGVEYVEKGDKTSARELLELSRKTASDDKTPMNARLLIVLAGNYAKLGDAALATALLTQARKQADALNEQSEWRPETIAEIAIAQRKAGDVAGAAETMKGAIAALTKMTNTGNQTHALWMIAGFQASAGDIAGSEATIQAALKGTMDPTETAMRAAAVATSLAHAGGPQVDLTWIDQLPTAEGKGLAYAGAAAGMVEGGAGK